MRPLALLMLAGCSSGVEAKRAAIIGGTRDSGDPAIVMLVSYPANQSTYYTCTSSLIAPSLLLTAAHCVDATNHPGYSFGAFTGDDASSYATTADLVAQLVPASYVHAHPSYNPSPPFDADIAVVELSAPLAAAPLPFLRVSPAPSLVGQAARLVGYGETSYPNFNAAKYQAATTVASLPAGDTVVVGDAQHRSCVGDSGGPALVVIGGVETIIGADSYTDTTGCTEASHYRRTDVYTAFLDGYLPASPDLGTPNDLQAPDLRTSDLGGVDLRKIDLRGADLRDAPDLSAPTTVAAASGCQAAPGRFPSLWWLIFSLAIAMRRWFAPPARYPRPPTPPAG